MTVELLVAGVVSLDTTLHIPFIPRENSECFARAISDMHGGAAANVAAYAAYYGSLSVGLIARVGEDTIADQLLSRLAQYRVDLQGTICTSKTPSTRIITLLLPDGSKTYMVHLGAHDQLSSKDIPPNHLSTASAFYVAPCSPNIHADILAFAHSHGKTVYFNPGSVYVEQSETQRLYSLLPLCDILFLNEPEALSYSHQTTIEQAGRFLLDLGPKHLIITASRRGSMVFSSGEPSPRVFPSIPSSYTNSIGAGDAFAAGFLIEHLNTGNIYAAIKKGAVYGAFAVTQNELRKPDPDPGDIDEFENQLR
jgi:2-dehydro-3-deoxygluconokinase